MAVQPAAQLAALRAALASLLLPAMVGLFACVAAAQVQAEQRPNFVVIMVDDLGWADLGCYGSRFHETPRLDRLAREGMRFTDGYAACTVCSPTRAAYMTGRYPARLGVTDWIRARFQGGAASQDKAPTEYVGGPKQRLLCPPNPFWLELSEVTLAERLAAAGYVAGHIGKWHLGPDDWSPEKQGFAENHGGCDFGHPPSYFDPYSNARLDGIPQLPPRRAREYLTDREADEAVSFLQRHRERPFFLSLCHYAVHTPLQAKQKLIAKYRAKPPTEQRNVVYAAMLESVDEAVGRVLDALDELKLSENTVVLFTSDNGGLLGPTNNAPLRSGKGFCYEGGTRVPWIVRWPGKVAAGAECRTPVITCDILPTLVELAGIAEKEISEKENAEKDASVLDGLSLAPLLRQQGEWGRTDLFWHFPHYRAAGVSPWAAIRSGDWKLIRHFDGERIELFDLAADLGEKNNLAEREPERAAELEGRLTRWLADVGAKLPRENPAYREP